jgi:HEPN domain-containing protein
MMKPHEEWIYYADQDLMSARSLFKDRIFTHVCFHAQQAVEKMMKAMLVKNDEPYPKSHDLNRLNSLIGRPIWLEPHLEHLIFLNQIYIPTRYPEAAVGTLPDRMPGEEEATHALKWAEEICQLIRDRL